MNNSNNLIFIKKEVKQLKSSEKISDLSYSQITRCYLQNEIIQDWLRRLEKMYNVMLKNFQCLGNSHYPINTISIVSCPLPDEMTFDRDRKAAVNI